MKTQLIIFLDKDPIIVNDENIEVNDFCYHYELNNGKIDKCYDKTLYHTWTDHGVDKDRKFNKIIAGHGDLPKIDFNGFEEELGVIDIKELAYEHYISDEKYSLRDAVHFGLGFQKARDLNKKIFDLEEVSIMFYDVIRSIAEGTLRKWNPTDFAKFIQSIQKPQIFDVEILMKNSYFINNEEVGEEVFLMTNEFWNGTDVLTQMKVPQVINNQIKITKITKDDQQ